MRQPSAVQSRLSHRLIQAGIVLFLLGLLTGFAIPAMTNPRMGLSSHLEGVTNGILLMVFGLFWTKLRLGDRALTLAFGLAVFGTFTNWATTLAAGFLGAGGNMMPIAAAEFSGTDTQEALIAAGLIALSVAMVTVSGMIIWGLRTGPLATTPNAAADAALE